MNAITKYNKTLYASRRKELAKRDSMNETIINKMVTITPAVNKTLIVPFDSKKALRKEIFPFLACSVSTGYNPEKNKSRKYTNTVEINKIPADMKILCAAKIERFEGSDAKRKKSLATPIPYSVINP